MLKGDVICKYIKDPVTRHRIGVVIATVCGDDRKTIVISWSKCHTHLDKYDSKLSMKIAEDRARYYYKFLVGGGDKVNVDNRPRLHTELVPLIDYIVARAKKFYKQADKIIVIPYRSAYEDIDKHGMLQREWENSMGKSYD